MKKSCFIIIFSLLLSISCFAEDRKEDYKAEIKESTKEFEERIEYLKKHPEEIPILEEYKLSSEYDKESNKTFIFRGKRKIASIIEKDNGSIINILNNKDRIFSILVTKNEKTSFIIKSEVLTFEKYKETNHSNYSIGIEFDEKNNVYKILALKDDFYEIYKLENGKLTPATQEEYAVLFFMNSEMSKYLPKAIENLMNKMMKESP